MKELRPFELMRLIREGVVTNIRDIPVVRTDQAMEVWAIIRHFADVGWVEFDEDGDRSIRATARIGEVQSALGISLAQLSPFGRDSVVANPVFGAPEAPPVAAEVFVLMPFADELRAVYEDHICSAARELSLTVARADDFFATNSIIRDVWNAIAQANIVIADCTGRNPNVFYELGIAHTLGRPAILVAQDMSDIPFDVRHVRAIIYDFTPRGMKKFESDLKATLEHETRYPRTITETLALRKNG